MVVPPSTGEIDFLNRELTGGKLSSIEIVWNYVQFIFQEKRLSVFPPFSIDFSNSPSVPKASVTLGMLEAFVIGKEFISFEFGLEMCTIRIGDIYIRIETGRSIDRETISYLNVSNPRASIII